MRSGWPYSNHEPTLLPSALKDYTFISPGSLQLLPSCPGSTVTTGTERRWHPGFPSPKSDWKRSWSATGPSASGTRFRRSSTRCRLRSFTRTVSRSTPGGFLKLRHLLRFPGCSLSCTLQKMSSEEKVKKLFQLHLILGKFQEVISRVEGSRKIIYKNRSWSWFAAATVAIYCISYLQICSNHLLKKCDFRTPGLLRIQSVCHRWIFFVVHGLHCTQVGLWTWTR